MSGLPFQAEEDRKADADTHLAVARSQNTGTGILGSIQKIKGSRISAVFFNIMSGVHICEEKQIRKASILWVGNFDGFIYHCRFDSGS